MNYTKIIILTLSIFFLSAIAVYSAPYNPWSGHITGVGKVGITPFMTVTMPAEKTDEEPDPQKTYSHNLFFNFGLCEKMDLFVGEGYSIYKGNGSVSSLSVFPRFKITEELAFALQVDVPLVRDSDNIYTWGIMPGLHFDKSCGKFSMWANLFFRYDIPSESSINVGGTEQDVNKWYSIIAYIAPEYKINDKISVYYEVDPTYKKEQASSNAESLWTLTTGPGLSLTFGSHSISIAYLFPTKGSATKRVEKTDPFGVTSITTESKDTDTEFKRGTISMWYYYEFDTKTK